MRSWALQLHNLGGAVKDMLYPSFPGNIVHKLELRQHRPLIGSRQKFTSNIPRKNVLQRQASLLKIIWQSRSVCSDTNAFLYAFKAVVATTLFFP
jgi:hypothetical protein